MLNEYPSSYVPFVRMYNSYILNPADSFETVALTLFGVQSQVFNASAIAFALRTQQQSFTQFMGLLKTLRLVRLWGIRTTLHIYHKDDWESLLAYLSTTGNWYRSKMTARGVDVERIVNKALKIMDGIDYFDRNVLINNGIDTEHLGSWGDLLIELNNRGYIFRRTDSSGRNRLFGNTRVVLGRKMKITRKITDVRRCIALRFFHAYAPATLHDFSHWLGITLHESKKYLRLVENDLMPVMCGDKMYFIESAKKEVFDQVLQEHIDDTCYRLLPKFDPLLLAYRDKTWIIEECSYSRIWRTAGHVEGVVLNRGKAIATWRYQLTNKDISFVVTPFRCRFSVKNIEKNCRKIASFFERPIGKIIISDNLL